MAAKPEYRLDKYQEDAMSTAIYPEEISRLLAMIEHHYSGAHAQISMLLRLNYVAAGLAGEAGEFANKIKKLIRDDAGFLYDPARKELAKELGGVLWYLAASCKEIGYTLSDVADMNRVQLAERNKAGAIKGQGDDR